VITKEALIRAQQDGRNAAPGTSNPYAGQPALASMWRQGYRTMLVDKLTNSPAAQAYERSRDA
jgi:hypothetical protein